jgi:hypothetical protein
MMGVPRRDVMPRMAGMAVVASMAVVRPSQGRRREQRQGQEQRRRKKNAGTREHVYRTPDVRLVLGADAAATDRQYRGIGQNKVTISGQIIHLSMNLMKLFHHVIFQLIADIVNFSIVNVLFTYIYHQISPRIRNLYCIDFLVTNILRRNTEAPCI